MNSISHDGYSGNPSVQDLYSQIDRLQKENTLLRQILERNGIPYQQELSMIFQQNPYDPGYGTPAGNPAPITSMQKHFKENRLPQMGYADTPEMNRPVQGPRACEVPMPNSLPVPSAQQNYTDRHPDIIHQPNRFYPCQEPAVPVL